jgi:hypothetical protein
MQEVGYDYITKTVMNQMVRDEEVANYINVMLLNLGLIDACTITAISALYSKLQIGIVNMVMFKHKDEPDRFVATTRLMFAAVRQDNYVEGREYIEMKIAEKLPQLQYRKISVESQSHKIYIVKLIVDVQLEKPVRLMCGVSICIPVKKRYTVWVDKIEKKNISLDDITFHYDCLLAKTNVYMRMKAYKMRFSIEISEK